MLNPHQMSSVIIAGPKYVQETVIKEMHKLKILHIVEHSRNELADIGNPLENASKLSEILVKIRALMSALSIKKEEIKFELKRGLLEIEPAAKKIGEEVTVNAEELKKVEEQMAKNQAAKQELEILKGLDVPLEAFASYRTLACFTGYVKGKNINALKRDLSKLTEKFMLFSGFAGKRAFIVLFIDAKSKEQAGNTIQKFGFFPVNFTNLNNLKGYAANNLKKLEEESAKLQNKKEEIRKKIDRLGREHKGFLTAADGFLSEQLEKAEAPLKFASTQSSFLVKGWIPSSELTKSIGQLNKVTKNRIFVHFEPAKKTDNVPVKLKNPEFVKPFEFFIDLYSMPAYREIDPTFFIFLTFPIFFGIMLGDVGYGAFSFILFWILKKKMPKAKNFFNILILASFVTILFGFLFGEFFGYEFVHPVISREHEMFKLLYIAVAIGIVHVNIGLAAGFINELKSHGFMHAIYAKASWFVVEVGFLLVALSIFHKISIPSFVGYAFLFISILMLFKGEGAKGLIELPSILTNIMSYARLMAIGLSSVILAVIVNGQAREFFHQGGFFVLIGALILAVGHLINLMLGLLGSFLHSLRLHYVEFFSKFFHGGAEKYKPFGMKEE